MVVVRIWEGLGNQLFQYAYARALQLRTGQKVYLDANRIYRDILEKKGVERKYTLDKFNVRLPHIYNIEKKYFFLKQENILEKLVYMLAKHNKWIWNFTEEEDTLYKENSRFVHGNCYVKGWFQDERYFREYRDILLKEFAPKKKIKISQSLREILKEKTTISVHVRRTDFKKYNNVLHVSYYKNAKSYIESKVDNPYYIIFTDDSEWVRKHLDFGNNVFFVQEEGLQDYEELFVMSRCTHSIIANSTFSWWGAWLNQNEDKIVVGPRQWFNYMKDAAKYNIMPAEWIRLD